MPWENVEKILRPDMNDVHMGVMKVDESKCNKCGLCIENCPFRAWEKDANDIPVMKEKYECFSCFNCKVACPNDAISIVDTYHVDGGYWKTEDVPLPARMPLDPKDEFGNPSEWTNVEKLVFNRRSVRNFKDKPVPEHIIQRIIEAGRFAPTGGNCQPWKFVVITDKELISQISKETYKILDFMFKSYVDDNLVKTLVPIVEGPPFAPGRVDPRVVLGGMGTVSRIGEEAVALNAPALILIFGDVRAISGVDLNIGICGQNMNLVAMSLGVGVCWNGFMANAIDNLRPIQRKLKIKKPWKCITSLCLGYPRFKQEGVVPREYRPVTWFREGKAGPEIQEKDTVLTDVKEQT